LSLEKCISTERRDAAVDRAPRSSASERTTERRAVSFRRTIMMRAESLGPETKRLTVGSTIVSTVRDDQFSVVRRAYDVADDFLDGNFDFAELGSGGGKGGDVMARTKDGKWFVKTLNAGDGKSLLDDEAFLKEYVGRVTSGQSLLTKIVAVFEHEGGGGETGKTTTKKKKQRYIVMNNCFNPRVEKWSRVYDLKGTADDKTLVKDGKSVFQQHKRFYRVDLLVRECFGCLRDVPVLRQRYVLGKREAFDCPIYLTEAQREEILTQLKNDVKLFERHGLMDYSLLVGIQRVAPGTVIEAIEMRDEDVFNKPYVVQYGGETLIMYFGVIDFLQRWTGGKKVAHVIKKIFAPRPISTVNPNAYARQFKEFFDYKMKGVGFEARLEDDRTARRIPSNRFGSRNDSPARSSPTVIERLYSAAGVLASED
jgi:hypothetical protein